MKLKHKNPLIEDTVSGCSHILGVILAIVGTFALIVRNYHNDSWHFWSTLIFGLSLILMYTTSSAYHLCRSVELKKKLRKLDHSAIYILIAGTYTPFCLISLRQSGSIGWIIFAITWGIAILGILLSYRHMKSNVSLIKTIGYIAMGAIVVSVMPSFYRVLSANNNEETLYWVLVGGIFYILGCVPYMLSKYRGMHSIWHFFVMGGSICHYIAVWSL